MLLPATVAIVFSVVVILVSGLVTFIAASFRATPLIYTLLSAEFIKVLDNCIPPI